MYGKRDDDLIPDWADYLKDEFSKIWSKAPPGSDLGNQ
jgi:hypothetical protein